MCGRFRLNDSAAVLALLEAVGVAQGELRYARDVTPSAPISIIRQAEDRREIVKATWWLCLDRNTFKPDYKYASFNSRWDKLNQPRSLAYNPYRHSRCIIPASAICEGLGDKKTYHMIEAEGRALAFGGLYREYYNRETGEVVLGASIITLPPVDKWANIHPKSIPLMLDVDNTVLISRWLDPDFQDVSVFEPLLISAIRHPQRVTPIDRPSKWNPIGDSFLIAP